MTTRHSIHSTPYDERTRINNQIRVSCIIANDTVKGIRRDNKEYEEIARYRRVDLGTARRDAETVLNTIQRKRPSLNEIYAALETIKAAEIQKATQEQAERFPNTVPWENLKRQKQKPVPPLEGRALTVPAIFLTLLSCVLLLPFVHTGMMNDLVGTLGLLFIASILLFVLFLKIIPIYQDIKHISINLLKGLLRISNTKKQKRLQRLIPYFCKTRINNPIRLLKLLDFKTIGRKTGKFLIIVATCVGIGSIKAALGPAPSLVNLSGYNSYALIHNVLSNLMWWAVLGLTRMLYGRKPMRIMWFLFIVFGGIPLLLSTFALIFAGWEDTIGYDILIAHASLVFIPWVVLVFSFYEPKKAGKKKEKRRESRTKHVLGSRLPAWLDHRHKELQARDDLEGADVHMTGMIFKRVVGEDLRRGLFDTESGCAEMSSIVELAAEGDPATQLLTQHIGNLYAEAQNEIFGMPDESAEILNFFMFLIPQTSKSKDLADLMFATLMAFFTLANHRASGKVKRGDDEVFIFNTAFDNILAHARKTPCPN